MSESEILTLACNRLALLIKTGKSPVDYKKLWRDFANKSPKSKKV